MLTIVSAKIGKKSKYFLDCMARDAGVSRSNLIGSLIDIAVGKYCKELLPEVKYSRILKFLEENHLIGGDNIPASRLFEAFVAYNVPLKNATEETIISICQELNSDKKGAKIVKELNETLKK